MVSGSPRVTHATRAVSYRWSVLPTDASRSDGAADSAPVTPDVAARAEALVKQFPECFWFWRPDAVVRSEDDVRLVIRHLRAHGGHDAWHAAQDLHACLSPRSNRTS
jgi:hypothetical protein